MRTAFHRALGEGDLFRATEGYCLCPGVAGTAADCAASVRFGGRIKAGDVLSRWHRVVDAKDEQAVARLGAPADGSRVLGRSSGAAGRYGAVRGQAAG